MNARIAEVGDMQIFMGFDSVGRLQYLSQDDVYIDGDKPSGLQAGDQVKVKLKWVLKLDTQTPAKPGT